MVNETDNRNYPLQHAPQARSLPALPNIIAQQSQAPLIITDDLKEFATIAYQSGYFSDVKSMAQAVMKVLYGRDYDMSPSESLGGLYIINGKISMYAEIMSEKIHRVPGLYIKELELNAKRCEAALMFDKDYSSGTGALEGEEVGRASFTFEQAQKLGLVNKPMWQADPESMLWARVVGRLYRRHGKRFLRLPSYTREELIGARTVEDDEVTNQIFANAGKRKGGKVVNADAARAALEQQGDEEDCQILASTDQSEQSDTTTAGATIAPTGSPKEGKQPSPSQQEPKSSAQPTSSSSTATSVQRPNREQMDELLLEGSKMGWNPENLIPWACAKFKIQTSEFRTKFTLAMWKTTLAHIKRHKPEA